MEFSRRQLLKYSVVGFAGSLAGCSEEGQVSNPTEDSETTTAETTPTAGSDSAVAQLGETLVYTKGKKKLAFTVTGASMKEAILSPISSDIYSQVPSKSAHTYLVLEVKVENRGDERITTPTDPLFLVNGTQYERKLIFDNNSYEGYNELVPGASTSGKLVYSIPPSDGTGELVVNFSLFGDATSGRWKVDLGEIPNETYDYTGLPAGKLITFGTDALQYQIGASKVTEQKSYTYTSGDYQFEETASSGNKFAFVYVTARNTGNNPVRLPMMTDMSLLTSSTQHSATFYSGQGGYEGGKVSPGVERSGPVLFEVPQSASDYTFQVNLTSDIPASWNL